MCLSNDWIKWDGACIWHVVEVVCNFIYEGCKCNGPAVFQGFPSKIF